MNLADLSRINIEDLSKLDYKKILKDLSHRPDLIIMIAAILGAGLFVFQRFNQIKNQTAASRSEQTRLEEQVAKLDAYNQAQASLNDFVTKIPPALSESGFVGLLTDLTRQRGILLNTLTPVRTSSSTYFDSMRVDISVSAQSYDDMHKFIYDIEHAPYSVRVENWSGSMGPPDNRALRQGRGQAADAGNWINARITLTAINLKKI